MRLNALIDRIYIKVGINSDRTKNIARHVLFSSFYKFGSIFLNFLMVPITINYLDTDNYGVWLTISSFIAWFSFFDIGLGNGLRNKFAAARAQGEEELAYAYVSTAYFSSIFIVTIICLLFLGVNFFVDWTKVFNAPAGLSRDLSLLMPLVFVFFCCQLVLKLIVTLYTADQHHSMQGKLNFLVQFFSLTVIWVLTKTSNTSLLLFAVVYSFIPIVLLSIFSIIGFKGRFRKYRPSLSKWKRKYLSDIFGLGFKFFVIQISGIVIFSTDSVIIANVLSPKEVVPYQLAYKVFAVSTMAFTIISSPYWSSFTEAYTKRDFAWIHTSLRVLNRYAYLFVLLSFALLLLSPVIYKVWIDDKVEVPIELSCLMCCYFAITLIITPYTIFINGTGKVMLQSWQSVLSALINIPLCFLFSVHLNMGTSGIILATIICLSPSLILSPIQTRLILRSKAGGIFNK